MSCRAALQRPEVHAAQDTGGAVGKDSAVSQDMLPWQQEQGADHMATH